jgi:LmbE family N-acetylglucosaminyl deacetylase
VTATLKLACVLAHPDDETLGMGGTLARCASEGIEVHVITATRGQSGRYRDNSAHPGPEALGRIREAELRAAARVLGVHGVHVLDYMDGSLDRVDPAETAGRIAGHLRRIRPQVVATFGPGSGADFR